MDAVVSFLSLIVLLLIGGMILRNIRSTNLDKKYCKKVMDDLEKDLKKGEQEKV